MPSTVSIRPITGLPLIQEGDDLSALLIEAVAAAGEALLEGDIIVLAQKIVSKAEGRTVDLGTVTPGEKAHALAAEVNKDPRMVEMILSESEEVVRHGHNVLIVAHKRGYVHANAGIDHSNVEGGEEIVLLLPEDADASARSLRESLERATGTRLGVIIADSFGRAWRKGTVGVAIGASGVDTLLDERGHTDLVGRTLEITEIGRADELAAAAGLVMGQAGEGIPAVIIRGVPTRTRAEGVGDLLRPKSQDLFR